MKKSYLLTLCLISSLCITPSTKPMQTTATICWHTVQTTVGILLIMDSLLSCVEKVRPHTYQSSFKSFHALTLLVAGITTANAGVSGLQHHC